MDARSAVRLLHHLSKKKNYQKSETILSTRWTQYVLAYRLPHRDLFNVTTKVTIGDGRKAFVLVIFLAGWIHAQVGGTQALCRYETQELIRARRPYKSEMDHLSQDGHVHC